LLLNNENEVGMQKNIKKIVLGIAAGMMLASSVMAQDSVIQEDDRVVYEKKTAVDFSDVNIEGELAAPEGSYIKNRKRTSFRSLIELRGHFRNEMRRSVDAL
jgi:hypothetical protein